jgi:hypothetical protein
VQAQAKREPIHPKIRHDLPICRPEVQPLSALPDR